MVTMTTMQSIISGRLSHIDFVKSILHYYFISQSKKNEELNFFVENLRVVCRNYKLKTLLSIHLHVPTHLLCFLVDNFHQMMLQGR